MDEDKTLDTPNPKNNKDLRIRKDFNKEAPYKANESMKVPAGNQQFIANRFKSKKVKSKNFTKDLYKNFANTNLIT